MRIGRERTGTIGFWFVLSAASSIALAVVYAQGGQPQLEGFLLMVSLGGIGMGIAVWGKRFFPPGPFVEQRSPIGSEEEARLRAAEAFERGTAVTRRTALKRLLLGAVAAFGAVLFFPIRSLGPSPGNALAVTAWRPGARMVTREGELLRVDDLAVGGVAVAFPEGHTNAADSQVMLIRLAEPLSDTVPGREDWSPEGFVAYSRICTHAGCPVGLYQQESHLLFCPCHQSAFDVLRNAKPISGPATVPLPQLPLFIDDEGYLRARSDFHEPVGPLTWRRPRP